ncbi:hypothetical protein CNR34_00154 [Pseudomonas phage nickie]|uniref:Uncharacterized protein n=1 Tax=Pseudomonas phage nickie TaxID=2048977 RepID=A0A2H4P7E9_9CAUD|nr:hypothetical protein FDJ16_gp011 [Pseudomonas phage nickie]ATW58087.1 hypothetical protein CNR34_00154 [Pseudomonas phage nickie]
MVQIMIPPLGTVIKLTEDWHFSLYDESRNEKLQKQCGLLPPFRDGEGLYEWRRLSLAERRKRIDESVWTHVPYGHSTDLWGGEWHTPFVLRAETRLKIDRIYIRQGQGDFDSVTFRSDCWMSNLGDPLFTKKYVNGRKVPSIRFWAKLADVNRIEGVFVNDR